MRGGSRNIRSRFAVSFAANVLRSFLNFFTGLVVARSLGPGHYGDLIFLIGSFEAIRQALAMGTESAFFTFISRRERGSGFLIAYVGWQLLQLALTLLIVGLLLPVKWFDAIWLGHDRSVVLLACVAVFFQSQAWQTAQQIGEASRLTIRVQAIGITVAAAHFAIVAVSAWAGALGIRFLLCLLVAEYAVALLAAWHLLRPRETAERSRIVHGNLRDWIGEFVAYCAPLLLYSLGSFLYEFSNKWLLQRYGGGEQQGLFAVASQFSAACLLAATSMVRILWKEAAELHHNGDDSKLRRLYESASRMLYGFGAVMGGLLWPWSSTIAVLALGEHYREAWLPLAIMLLYPTHQSLGQVMQTLFLATGNTVTYFLVGISFMAVSIPVTYLVLAPATADVPGLGLGAVGMALKTLLLNALFVNIYIWRLCRAQRWRMAVGYQFAVLGWSAALGGVAYWIAARSPLAGSLPMVAQMAICCVTYGVLQLVFLVRFPGLFGISAEVAGSVRVRAANVFKSIR